MFAPGFFGGFAAPTYFPPGGLRIAAAAGGFFSPGYFPGGFFTPGYFPNTGFALPGAEAPVATSFDEVLYAVRGMLLGGGLGTETTVVVSLVPDPAPTVALQFILCPGPLRTREGYADGNGRALTILEGSFSIDVVGQKAVDQGNRDLRRLTAAGGNILRDAHRVMDRLQEQFVVDARGNHLSLEPVWALDHGKPRHYGRDATFAGVELRFSIAFQARMA